MPTASGTTLHPTSVTEDTCKIVFVTIAKHVDIRS